MKRLLYIAQLLFILALIPSCDGITNYLDKAPGVDVTEDTIFSSRTQVETFVAGTYYYGVMTDMFAYWDERDKSDCGVAPATDECEIAPSWFWVQGAWNSAGMRAGSNFDTGDRRFYTHWTALRRANTLIERIDKAPFDDAAYKQQVRGEAKFIRALTNFELFKKYGGIPILRRRFSPSDNFNVARGSVKEVVDFILEDCRDAIFDLPHANEYPSNMKGRATKAAAMALKSRTLLYAASQTYNTAKPYMSMGADNGLICYGDYSADRWKLAADAAKDVIDEALASGIHLVTDQGVDKNYRYVWEVADNAEIILSEKSSGMRYTGHFPWGYYMPTQGYWATHNFVKLYERKDGKPQPWKAEGGENLMDIYNNMDPRFKQTFASHGEPFNDDYPALDLTMTGLNSPKSSGCHGSIVHKPIPYTVKVTGNVGAIPNGIIFKLSEFYLNYAEALNEYSATPPDEAYDAVDEIRARSGMPKLPRNMDQTEFRKRVRNERAIELAFEGHRLWDIRRWEIADEGIMKGAMYGIKQYKIPGSTEIRYVPYVFEVRSFKTAMYRNPFPQLEIDKGYLIQNPGY